MHEADVLIIGAGISGISAAVHLAQYGFHPVLLEQRKLLGGRAGSFAHALGPQGLLDNSQHVLLGCCTALQDLYRRLGVSHLIRFDDTIRFADASGRRSDMQAVYLPSPLHLGPSMAGFSLLTFGQKSEIARCMMRMMLDGQEGRQAAEEQGISFETYLRSNSQSPATIRDFWNVICISALNEPSSDASAKYALQVFQEAFLGGRHDYHLGYAKAPLSTLYEHLPNVEVRRSTQVCELLVEENRVRGVRLTGGEEFRAHHVVLATGGPAAVSLLRPILHLDPRFAAIQQMQYRPILGAHLLYDKPITIPSPIALVGTHLQWAFVDEQRPELIHGVVSAADLLPDGADLPQLFDRELKAVFPELAGHLLQDNVMVKESRATFRPLPGVDRYRPSQATLIPGLSLAGDYTRTDWPSTMESAARSGILAADVVASHLELP